jgi:hypothetical protein
MLDRIAFKKRILNSKDKVVFLELNNRERIPKSNGGWMESYSRWIVLPDRNMVLWEFQGALPENWSEKQFNTFDCYGWKCAGALISESGEIVQR